MSESEGGEEDQGAGGPSKGPPLQKALGHLFEGDTMKKRTLAVILLGLFLTSLTFPLFSTTVFASPDPTTIGTSTTALAVGFPDQHKGFYANGRHWVFYVNGTHMVYKTSADDGSSWNNFTVIRSGVVSGRDFSIYFDGTYVHYVFANFTLDVAIYYRRGTPNLDGSITWSDDEQIAVPSSASDQYLALIATDSNGYPFISYKDNDYPYVTKSSLNNGTWQTASGFPHQLTSTSGTTWRSVIIPLTSGKMYAYYLKTGPAPQLIYGQLWNGTNWGSEETVSQWTPSSNYMVSAVNYGDDIHLVYCNVTSRDILYTKRTYGSGWSADETIQTSAQAPALSLVSGTGDLYCFWMDAPTADHVYYKKYDQATGVWDESPTDWFTETEGLANDEYQSSYYEDYGERIGFLYTSSSPSPYNVRFTYISTSNTSPTMGEFEAPSSVYAGTTYAFNATVVDSDGRSTLNNCSLALDFGSMKFNWFEVDNSTTITDPSNYATLDSSSVAVVNATAYKITWNVSFFSNVTEGYVSLTTGTIVYDDSDATGT
ncbi:MAG: hypothetical protein H3Z50_06100, partial [archaeon]|nr:hypothetical protein [archaeon]